MKYQPKVALVCAVTIAACICCGCSPTESSRTITPSVSSTSQRIYAGPKLAVAVGKMVNRSPYLNGLFSSGQDQLGLQATQMLVMHLTQSGRFDVGDRTNLDEANAEAKWLNKKAKVAGANYLISGVVTEFGRRETGSVGLGGIISKSRTQMMYGKVSLSFINVLNSQVLASSAGAGEVELGTSEVLGFGSRAGFDGTLADKVLDLAIREAMDSLVNTLETKGIMK